MKFIYLVVDEQFESSKAKRKFRQNMASLSKVMCFEKLNIKVGDVNMNAERFMELILAMRTADNADDKKALMSKGLPKIVLRYCS